MSKSQEEKRLEVERRNAEDIRDAVRETNPREAERQDNAATGLSAEIEHVRGNDPGEGRR